MKQYGCFKLLHFSKKSGRLSSAGPEILAFGSQCSANFRLILDYFILNLKLEYDDSEYIKLNHSNTIVFKLRQIKQMNVFLGHPVEG